MKIIDLTTEHKQLYLVCLEEWSEEIKEAGDHKEVWVQQNEGPGSPGETSNR